MIRVNVNLLADMKYLSTINSTTRICDLRKNNNSSNFQGIQISKSLKSTASFQRHVIEGEISSLKDAPTS